MRPLFLDSSGWFAAMSPRETGHALAAGTYAEARSAGAEIVTSDLVIAEMHTLVLRTRDARGGREFLDAVFESPSHTVVHADAELTQAALARWIRGFKDQPFSLCDAVSFEVMRRERIARALTFDRHFSIAGFETLD